MPFFRHCVRILWFSIAVGALALTPLLLTAHALAQNQNAAISQGFVIPDANATVGVLVSIKAENGNTAELAHVENVDRIIGVIGDNPLIELSDSNQEQQVVTSGVTLALVSDINGDIKAADKITASPIDGVGMKTTRSTTIVGTAQADLSSVKRTQRQITDASGNPHTIALGLIPVQVNVSYYAPPDERTSFLPPFFQDFANSIAGREVSAVRVILAAIILLLALMSIAVLLYSSVQSSIISIGRNPLSEGAVRKSLFQVGFTIFGILLLTVIAIYLILRL